MKLPGTREEKNRLILSLFCVVCRLRKDKDISARAPKHQQQDGRPREPVAGGRRDPEQPGAGVLDRIAFTPAASSPLGRRAWPWSGEWAQPGVGFLPPQPHSRGRRGH